jgi:hypothetical protein
MAFSTGLLKCWKWADFYKELVSYNNQLFKARKGEKRRMR